MLWKSLKKNEFWWLRLTKSDFQTLQLPYFLLFVSFSFTSLIMVDCFLTLPSFTFTTFHTSLMRFTDSLNLGAYNISFVFTHLKKTFYLQDNIKFPVDSSYFLVQLSFYAGKPIFIYTFRFIMHLQKMVTFPLRHRKTCNYKQM